jgi:kinesin family protein 1
MEGQTTTLIPPKKRTRDGRQEDKVESKSFTFDYSYQSCDRDTPGYASQETVFSNLGASLIEKTLAGYNCCIFAYGQTGSGKSYSMMGAEDDPGLIPLICAQLFKRIDEESRQAESTFRVEVSYLEIYSERVRDLLNPKSKGNLRVREHPSTGPYVEELSRLVVSNFSDVALLMDQGNKARTVAATAMNDVSSRSHAVFSIIVTHMQEIANLKTEKVAKISLVDLAGSERANSTGATGARLKEGAEINKSLSTLGRVIHALVEKQALPRASARHLSVPYRDSILTWLLKDSLGGNSFTAMVATISPADISWDESLSTLRYADSAKRIKNHAVVNEDPNAKMIRELRQELEDLKMQMKNRDTTSLISSTADQMLTIIGPDGQPTQVSKSEMIERMEQASKLMADINESWEEKMRKTQQIQRERELALESLGIELSSDLIGISTPKKLPHLVNLSEEPLLTECLVYNLKPGRTRCGNIDESSECEIQLGGTSILPVHCFFDNEDGVVILEAMPGATIMVNGLRLTGKKRLRSGYRIIIGDEAIQIFRFNHPEEARAERLSRTLTTDGSLPATPSFETSSLRRSLLSPEPPRTGTDVRPESSVSSYVPLSSESPSQWTSDIQAIKPDHARALLDTPLSSFENMADDELRILSDNLEQVKASRLSFRPRPNASMAEPLTDKARAEHDALLQALNAAAIADEGRQHRSNVAERAAQVRDSVNAELEQRRSQAAQCRRERLVKAALAKWKAQRSVALARTLIQAAEVATAANNAAAQLGSEAIVQLSLAPGNLAFAVSPLESDSVYESVRAAESTDTQAQVLMRIMDPDKGLVQLRTIDQIRERLARIAASTDHTPGSRTKSEGLLEKPVPRFSLLGTTVVAIDDLNDSQTIQADIYSPHTQVHAAVLQLSIAVEKRSSSRRMVKLHLQQLMGIQEREATAVHVFAYFESEPEKCLTSQERSGFRDSPILLNSRHACSVSAESLPNKMFFQIWGEATGEHIEKLLSWDDLQEANGAQIVKATSQPSEHHMAILCKICISELNTLGIYEPVDVLSTAIDQQGFFYLHQGLSRRITVSLADSNGSAIPMSRILRMMVSDVRLVDDDDNRKRLSTPGGDAVVLKIITPGTYTLGKGIPQKELRDAIAQWDSSVHNTAAVDRITPAGQLVQVTLEIITVGINGKTAKWRAELSMRIFGREQQPSLFQRVLGQHKLGKTCYLVFAEQVDHLPRSIDLGIVPRGLSLLKGWDKMRRTQDKQLQVRTFQSVAMAAHTTPVAVVPSLIEDIVCYWQRRTQANLPVDMSLRFHPTTYGADDTAPTHCLQTIKIDDAIARAGHLFFPQNGLNKKWVRSYVVARGPWLLQYTHSTQIELLAVCHLSNILYFVQDAASTTGRHRFKLVSKTAGEERPGQDELAFHFEAASEANVQAWRQVFLPSTAKPTVPV